MQPELALLIFYTSGQRENHVEGNMSGLSSSTKSSLRKSNTSSHERTIFAEPPKLSKIEALNYNDKKHIFDNLDVNNHQLSTV